jgi:hypothetical protein
MIHAWNEDFPLLQYADTEAIAFSTTTQAAGARILQALTLHQT